MRSHMTLSYDPFKMATVPLRKILGILVVFVFAGVSCDVSERQVEVIPWPDCCDPHHAPPCDPHCEQAKQEGLIVVYAKAKSSEQDNLLYAFSTIGTPTIVLARVVGNDIDMKFNWEKLVNRSSLEGAITINGVVLYKFGVAFTRLIEYNDTDDSADLQHVDSKPNNTANWNIKDFNNFNWTYEADSTSKNSFVFNATSERDNSFPNTTHELGDSGSASNWSISFRFTVRGGSGRSSELPSLKYGANETEFDFVISNYTPSFSKSRFAVEAVLVSQSSSKDMSIDTVDSIDDEYSPGVFQIINWLANPSQPDSNGFFQWKPVCYTSSSRSRSAATKVKYYDLTDLSDRENTTMLLNSSIIYTLFDENAIMRATNVSFGLSQDGFYLLSNYTAWTSAFGYGSAPVDSISLMVIVIISAGLGLPVVILVVGGVYTCVRKARKKKSEYQAINSDNVSRSNPMVN